MGQKLIIFGCGGHARSVLDILLDNRMDYDIIFIDENAVEGEYILEYPVLKKYVYQGNEKFFVAIGDNKLRKKIMLDIGDENLINVVSKTAYIGYDTVIGRGVYIGEGVHLGPDVKVGDGAIINTNTIIEHESNIGEFTHVAPKSVVCGRCTIGDCVMLGAGSTVIDKILITDHVVVGAGSVVIKNILEQGVYVGNPIRKIRERE